MAAYFHARHAGGLGDSPEVIARATGYSSPSIKLMISEHEALLDRQRRQAAAQAADAPLDEWEDIPSFPTASPPRADGWVWYYGRAYAGHYMGQTEDGAYMRMKIKPARAQTVKWIPVHVDLRSTITPMVMDWIRRLRAQDVARRATSTPVATSSWTAPASGGAGRAAMRRRRHEGGRMAIAA
jgi:hypothetical protein